ncbi:Carboxymethylenebutenolidase [Chthoniobacter flavus Ellin428]|uniref:Carboxymethylenebutenolidase n=1 Tax=Chthoniobacter flavus Ellin428 TaxID=497964 RepID=B4D690_9BACT|nr:dienelactone hydrolase family protein [Chthoniobacter flavus]EDY17999.1 Carboxymethylenebutenolidase [Chthoniobacter flavus Ellin428]TCO88241.1 carboxymethylenebutenolidase [Chthoniobacter flavus]
MNQSDRPSASQFDQELLDLYDDYAHSRIGRRDFFERASKFAVGGITAAALLEMLSPNYAWATQIAKDDSRLKTEMDEYDSPKGAGKMKGYLAKPAKLEGKRPGVIVVHENRGLNPYIEDVVRRVAVEGYIAFGPDALTPLGGYPGDDEKGKELQAKRKPEEITEDFIAAAEWLAKNPDCNGKIGVVGFCFGGGMANTLAVRLPDLVVAAVPFYGRQPAADDVPKIKAQLCIHYAGLDTRIDEGWPAYEAALKKAGVKYEEYLYPNVNHGFHNDTTPRYDEAAAKLAWSRTVAFFKKTLG